MIGTVHDDMLTFKRFCKLVEFEQRADKYRYEFVKDPIEYYGHRIDKNSLHKSKVTELEAPKPGFGQVLS